MGLHPSAWVLRSIEFERSYSLVLSRSHPFGCCGFLSFSLFLLLSSSFSLFLLLSSSFFFSTSRSEILRVTCGLLLWKCCVPRIEVQYSMIDVTFHVYKRTILIYSSFYMIVYRK